MTIRHSASIALAVLAALLAAAPAHSWQPLPITDDPLVRMPGTQPTDGVNLESPNRCLNCHGGYDQATEPGHQWLGSMMAQSARDPIFWSTMVVAAQDSIWALGNPNAADLCERCHFPAGWLQGRSDPPNASAMAGSDYDGVHCDFCHRAWDPFFADTHSGDREGGDWIGYWDEANNTGPGSGTLSQTEADRTYVEDQALAAATSRFDGGPFHVGDRPASASYTENASGQFFVSPQSAKRASFADAAARHTSLYSRYHKSKYFCGTCHDVSNPVLANLGLSGLPDDGSGALTTEQYSAFKYLHVERTFSEFMLSAYGRPGGAATNAEFQAQGAPTVTHAATCQDCHMRDVNGRAANKRNAVNRPAGSSEHPNSGLPLHDMTGGNAWISRILASLDPAGPVYDPVNVQLLDQGPAVLTLDLSAGQSPVSNGVALADGSDRALQQLRLAASITALDYDPATGLLTFRIQNNSGHKLLTGYPEGRRMFVHIAAFDDAGAVLAEINPYDESVGTLRGLPGGIPLAANQRYIDELVYETHSSSSLTGELHTFHFVLADGRSKDNRIPPRGFDIAAAPSRLSVPIDPATHAEDASYFSAAEYAGGYDQHSLTLVADAAYVELTVYYQGTSREYIQFLRDEINGLGATLDAPTPAGEAVAYIAQTDPFFAQLRAWGDTIWSLWHHNHGLDGSGVAIPGIVPFAMAHATVGQPPAPACDSPGMPQNLIATGGKRRADLTWGSGTPPPGDGYRIYYDQAGKLQFVAQSAEQSYEDRGLKPDNEVCYAVTAWTDCDASGSFETDIDNESAPSNVACAIPARR